MRSARELAFVGSLIGLVGSSSRRDFAADLNACLGSGRCGDGAGDAGAAGPLIAVRLTGRYYLESGGVREVPPPAGAVTGAWFSTASGAVLSPAVPGADAGLWTIVELSPDASFTLEFERLDVDQRAWVDHAFLSTAERRLDLSQPIPGRPDAAPPEPNSTVAVSLSGLSPWGAADDLELIAVNAGEVLSTLVSIGGVTPVAGQDPAVGDTTAGFEVACEDAELTWQIQASQGDYLYVVQL